MRQGRFDALSAPAARSGRIVVPEEAAKSTRGGLYWVTIYYYQTNHVGTGTMNTVAAR